MISFEWLSLPEIVGSRFTTIEETDYGMWKLQGYNVGDDMILEEPEEFILSDTIEEVRE